MKRFLLFPTPDGVRRCATIAILLLAAATPVIAGTTEAANPRPSTAAAAVVPATAASDTFHSADTDRDGSLSRSEITRVIQLYNTQNGAVRTGAYTTATGTEDGFAPDPTRAPDTTVTLAKYHSADSNHDGQISLLELTRAIELYDYHSGSLRTGYYHVQSGSEDGFAPGLNYAGTLSGNAVPAGGRAIGDYYLISSAGQSQSTTWQTGDYAVWTGTKWQQLSYSSTDTSGPALAALANAPSLAPAKASNLQNASRKVFRVFYGGTSIENMAWSWGYHLRESLMRQFGDSGNRTLYTQSFGGSPGQAFGWYKQRYGGLTFYRLRGNALNVQGPGSTTPIAPLVFTAQVREFVVHYSTEPDGGQMTVQIDGAAPANDATVNCKGPQAYNRKVVYSFPTPGVHTITISCPQDSTTFGYFETIDLNLNNPGIAFVDGSLGGSSINQMCDPEPIGGASGWGGVWKSGTSYSTGIDVADPVDGHCYQARNPVQGSTPPRNDPTNWQQNGEDPPSPQKTPLLGVDSYMLDNDPLDRFDLVIFAWVVNDAGCGAGSFSTYYVPALNELVTKTRANGQQLMLVTEMGGAYLADTNGGINPTYSSITSLLKSYAAQPHVLFIDWNAAAAIPGSTLVSDWQAYVDTYYNSHALLRGAVSPGASALVVDDSSSIVGGARLVLDSGANQEALTVAGDYANIQTSGTATIPLAGPTTKAHSTGTVLAWNYPGPTTITSVAPNLAFGGNFIHPAPAGHAVAYSLACAALDLASDGKIGDAYTDGAPRLLASDPSLPSIATPPQSSLQPINGTGPRATDNTGLPDNSLRSIGQSSYGLHELSPGTPLLQPLYTSDVEQNLLPYYNEQIQASATSDSFGRYIDVTNAGATTYPFRNLDGKYVTWTLIVGPGTYFWDVSDGDTNTHHLHAIVDGRDIGPMSYWGTNTTGRTIVVHCTTRWEGSSSRVSFRGMPHLYGLYATATNYPCIPNASFKSWTIGAPAWMNGSDITIDQSRSGQTYYENAYDRNGMAIVLGKTCVGGRVRRPDGTLTALYSVKNPDQVYALTLNAGTTPGAYDSILGGGVQSFTLGNGFARGPQWPTWTAGSNYTRGSLVVQAGTGLFAARNTVMNSTSSPASDTANWSAEPNYGIYAVAGSKWTILARLQNTDPGAHIGRLAWIPTSGGNGTRYWNDRLKTWDAAESADTSFSYDATREENFAVTVTMASGMGVGQFEVRMDLTTASSALTILPGSSAGY